MYIENLNGIVKVVADPGKRLTNKDRSFFVEYLYLGKSDSAKHYIEVGKEVWGVFVKDDNLETRLDGIDNTLSNIKDNQDFQNISIDSTMVALMDTVDNVDESQNIQDTAIDSTMVALMDTVDIIYTMIDELIQTGTSTKNNRTLNYSASTFDIIKGGHLKMVDFYVVAIQRGLRKLEEVPERYRSEVEKALNVVEK